MCVLIGLTKCPVTCVSRCSVLHAHLLQNLVHVGFCTAKWVTDPPDRDTLFWVGYGAVLEPVGAHTDQPLKLKAAAVHRVLTTDGQSRRYSCWDTAVGNSLKDWLWLSVR